MLLDSLERLAKADSRYQGTYVELKHFFERHGDWELLDPTIIARDLPLLDSFALAGALNEAVQNGLLRVRYTVLTPDGVIATDLYDSPSSIPPTLPDRFEEPFETSRFPLVTVFEAVSTATGFDNDEDENFFTIEADS
jgi:hypothetical protein